MKRGSALSIRDASGSAKIAAGSEFALRIIRDRKAQTNVEVSL
jgi:hypothetical protein